MFINAFIVYALCDARTHQIRYIGSSEVGISRPASHHGYKNNPEVHAWYRDLVVCGSEPIILVLARAKDVGELRAFEAYWIKQGKHWGWPLLNRQGFTLDAVEVEPLVERAQPPKLEGRKWQLEEWRRDPEVKAALSAARTLRPAARVNRKKHP